MNTTPATVSAPVPAALAAPSPKAPPPQAAASGAAAAALARAGALTGSRPAAVAPPKPVAATPDPPAATPWRTFFADWPEQIPKRGILISRLNEAAPFKAFMLRGDFLLLERTSPDSLGGRFLVIPFDEISTVKFTDPLKQPALEAAGFVGKLCD